MPILVVLFCLFVVYPIATHITVFVHELGHSIAALLFSTGTVEMYVGSYGDKENSRKIPLGRLHIYLEKKSILWKKGLCVPSKPMGNDWQEALMVFAGPAFSLLLGLGIWLAVYNGDDPASALGKILAPMFIVSAVADFIRNITPNPRPILLQNGTITYNDGQQLREMFFQKQKRHDFQSALRLVSESRFSEAAPVFEQLAQNKFRQAAAYQWAILNYWHAGNLEKATALAQLDYPDNTYRTTHRQDLGIMLSMAGKHEEALGVFDQLQSEKPDDHDALANQGFARIMFERYAEAKPNFEKILAENPDHGYAISQLAYIKYRENGAPAGLEDLEKACEMAPNDPYVLRNLAIYHLEQGQKAEAEALFKKAYEINPLTVGVKKYCDQLAGALLP
ncbi:MAG: M50 family metallopeptidase [Saprospiraceae bacterium]